jgi:hypothetical protein
MVVSVHLDLQRAHNLCEQAALLQGEVVSGFGDRAISVMVKPPRCIEQVLIEGSPEVNVEQLHSATDRQHGHVSLERGPDHRELEAIPPLAHVVGTGVALAPVQLRIHVSTAAQHKSGSASETGRVVGVDLGTELDVVGYLLRWELLECR